MNRLNLCVLQQDYRVQYGCSAEKIEVPGGHARYKKQTNSKKHLVSASLKLKPDDYLYFRAFYKNWLRNPQPFLMELIIEDSEYKDYVVNFVPQSVKFDELHGDIISLSFQLVVVITKAIALTSKPYPIYHVESVQSETAIKDMSQLSIGAFEQVQSSVAISSLIIADTVTYRKYQLDSEKVKSSISISSLILADTVSYRKYGLSEKVQSSVAIKSLQLQALLISTKMETESVKSSIAITSIIVG